MGYLNWLRRDHIESDIPIEHNTDETEDLLVANPNHQNLHSDREEDDDSTGLIGQSNED